MKNMLLGEKEEQEVIHKLAEVGYAHDTRPRVLGTAKMPIYLTADLYHSQAVQSFVRHQKLHVVQAPRFGKVFNKSNTQG